MTSKYLMMGENPRRCPEVPCHLTPPLRETWTVPYDGAAIPPLIEGGLVFLRRSDDTLAAIAENDRRVVWEYDHRGALKLLHDGQLYFAGYDEHLHIIDSRTGAARALLPINVIGHAAVIRGLFVCTVGFSGLFAADPSSGKELWRYNVPEGSMFSSIFCATDDRIIVGQDERVLALSSETGRILWEHSVADLPLRMPGEEDRPGATGGMGRIHGSIVIVTAAKDFVLGLSVENGERLWTWTSDLSRAVSAGAGYLYGARYYQTGANGSYHIIDANTGVTVFETLLKQGLPKKQHTAWGWSPILISETHVFVGSRDGHILAFARNSGEYVWSILPKRSSSVTDFSSVNERLYCGDLGGRLRCLAPMGR